ncbi:hypothetical protein ACIA8K_18040 [Catenuloplanes sp. NPDC051500]|uniref:hypothetical protein n=1 Tax=Catenuloplanes sp. NPDC051500 TaxID=3363959 RepID=UPI0037AAE3B7
MIDFRLSRWAVRPSAVAALAALVTTVALTACAAPPGEPQAPPSTGVSAAAPRSSTAPVFAANDYRQLGLCTIDCTTTGILPFDHPQWGPTWLLTFQGGGPSATVPHESGLLAVGDDRTVHWSRPGGDWTEIHPAEPATDRTGHLFVLYNPGRYDGLLVLAPTRAGFDDFGSLPDEAELPTSRFYSVTPVDTDNDGIIEIRQDLNTCTPNCAEGTVETTVLRWTGSDYQPE